jgi:SdrD B-like domain
MRLLSALGFAVRPAPARKSRPRPLAFEGLGDRINPTSLPLPPSQVSGLVYVDQDRDGVADDTEPRLSGVNVLITGTTAGGASFGATTTTDAGGIYMFTGLAAGTYTIAAVTPVGYLPGQSSTGAWGGTTGPNITTNISIPGGQSSGGYNFGELTVQVNPCPCHCPPQPPACPPNDNGPRPRGDNNGKHKGHDKDKDKDRCDQGNHGKDKDARPKGNNGVGNGLDPQPPGNPPINDGPGTAPGSPGNRAVAKR